MDNGGCGCRKGVGAGAGVLLSPGPPKRRSTAADSLPPQANSAFIAELRSKPMALKRDTRASNST